MGCRSWVQVWPKFIHCSCCAVCIIVSYTVYPKKYAHGFVVLCFVVVMQSFIMNSHEVFIHIHQGCFAGTGAIVRLPQCQWSKPDGYGKISQCITTTKQKPCAYFLGYTVWPRYINNLLHWFSYVETDHYTISATCWTITVFYHLIPFRCWITGDLKQIIILILAFVGRRMVID